PMSVLDRLRATSSLAEPMRRSGRALASAAVMRLLGMLPPRVHHRAARAMYRSRYFTAIVSNMPGPSVGLRMAGAPIKDVYPIIPLAEGVPLGVGALGWNGQLCLSALADPQCLPTASALADVVVSVIAEMREAMAATVARGGAAFSGG